jgi:two-component system, chemotaxis family, CheB/CheR fusion protein
VLTSARGHPEREVFAREIVERLQRLGIAQSLLLDSTGLGTPTLDTLVRRLTEPFCGNAASLDIQPLPDVTLDEAQVRTLALVLGEFSTNSNKYGALGNGGAIAIRGAIADGVLNLKWVETSDLPVAAHERDGSAGLSLIRRTLAAHGGSLAIAWQANGLEIDMAMPGF